MQRCSVLGPIHSHLKRPPGVGGFLPRFVHWELPSLMLLSARADHRWLNGITFLQISFRLLLVFGFFGGRHPFYHQGKSYKTAYTEKSLLPLVLSVTCQ